MVETDRRPLVNAGDPIVTVERTEALRDGWVTSGKVSYSLERGDEVTIGVLEFSFRDAPPQSEAIARALSK